MESLKYYPMMFGKEEKERRSRSAGKSGGKHEQERDRIVPERGHLSGEKDFCGIWNPGEFIGSATRANVSYFKKLEMYDDRNEEAPCPMFGSLSRESWAGTRKDS